MLVCHLRENLGSNSHSKNEYYTTMRINIVDVITTRVVQYMQRNRPDEREVSQIRINKSILCCELS